MKTAALESLKSALVAPAPADVDMSLAEALADLALRLGVTWDKNVLDGYEGERGFSPQGRALAIIGAVTGSWLLIAAAVQGVVSALG